MSDALWSGRRFRTFNAIYEFNREGLHIKVDTSLLAARVIRALDELVEVLGAIQRRRPQSHPTWQAHAERLCRKIQQDLPHRGSRLLRLRQLEGSA